MGDPESHSYDVESEEHISFVARNAVPSLLQQRVQCFELSCLRSNLAAPDVSLSELLCYHLCPGLNTSILCSVI